MRTKLNLATMLLCVGSIAHAQNYNPIPIPCKTINTVNFVFSNNVTIEEECINDQPNTILGIIITGNKNVELKAADEILLDDEVRIAPNPNGNFYAHIEDPEIELALYEPTQNPGIVPQYEKLELGLKLPSNILDQIENYIQEIPNSSKLNPFNPEQVDVKAEFWRNTDPNGIGAWIGPLKVYGFFYEEFIENTTDASSINWTLDNIATEHKFRVRFAPPATGIWRCRITATINKNTPQEIIYSANEFTFGCIQSGNPGYVRVASNKHFLTLGGQTYFPSGRNIPQPDLTQNNNDANTLYDITNLDNINGYDNRKINPAFHKTFRDDLTKYKNAGGEYFRTLFYGDWYEIEFEKLNNYYDRLNTAWEFDRMINHCKTLSLKMDFCLSNYEYGQLKGDYTQKWDWASPAQLVADSNNEYDCISDPSNTNGYCYNTELGVASPEAFLTDADAIKYYQYRLRYIVSRWGYSTDISIMMLQAEMNNHSRYNVLQKINGDCKTITDHYDYYDNGSSYLEDVAFWQNEMCKFLKTDQYFPHLTSVNYTGCPRLMYDSAYIHTSNHTLYAIQDGDESYYSSYVDVATYDHYKDFKEQFKSMYENSRDLVYDPNTYMDIAPKINKPLMIAEMGDANAQHCDYGIGYIKDVWISSFTGIAGSGMNWQYQYQYGKMQNNTNLKNFLAGINLSSIDWAPGRQERGDKKAAIYYLRSDENQKRAIGVIDNQTVNQYSQGNQNCGYDEPEQPYNTAVTVAHNILNPNQRLTVGGMGFVKRYTIDYYNAISGAYLGTDHSKYSQLDGELRLEYPPLATSFFGNGFLVAFKIRRYGEPSFLTAFDTLYMHDESLLTELSLINDTLPVIPLTLWENDSNGDTLSFEVKPNPTNGIVTVKVPKTTNPTGQITLYNENGVLIESKNFQSEIITFDLTGLAAGTYLLILDTNGEKRTKKIIKL